MKEQKRGGGTLREYRVLHWRITVETYNARTPKLWQVTLFDEVGALRLATDAIHASLKRVAKDLTAYDNGGDVPRLAKAGERVGGESQQPETANHAAVGNETSAPAPTPLTESDS